MVVVRPIEYRDNGKLAREKINEIMQAVVDSIPSIGENGHRYIGGTDTGITARGVEIRDEDNLIKQTVEGETYVDLQFEENLTPTSIFPIGVTTGIVKEEDGRKADGILLNMKTSSGYCRLLYGDNGELYFDGGMGVLKELATKDYVNDKLKELSDGLHKVAFTGKSSDLDNDAQFTPVKMVTAEEYANIPGTGGDDKVYCIYE